MSIGSAKGPMIQPPVEQRLSDTESFADDAVAAQKHKKSQAKKGAKDARKQSRAAEMAAKAKQVQEVRFSDGKEDKRADSVKTDEKRGPQIQDRKQGGKGQQAAAGEQALASAAGEMESINKLLTQVAEVFDAADIMADGAFLDDQIAAQKATAKDSEKKAKEARRKGESSKRLHDKASKTGKSGEMGDGAGKDKEDRSVRAIQQAKDARQADMVARTKVGPGGELTEAQKELAAKLKTDDLGEMLEVLNKRAAALLKLGAKLGKSLEANAKVSEMLDLAAILEATHNKFRNLLMPLMLGEFGPLRKEPCDQFRTLFDQVEQWPPTIPPGHQAERLADGTCSWSTEDWNEFIAWVFEPPPPEEVEW